MYAHSRLASSLSIRDAGSVTGSSEADLWARRRAVQTLAGLARDVHRSVTSLRETIDLRRSHRASSAAHAESSLGLALSSNPTAARLTSTDEVNTTSTSYSAPSAFEGSSTATPSIGGTYDGSQGDNTLTFEAVIGGVVGLSLIRVEVVDESAQVVESVDFGPGYAPGESKVLSNGLELALESGTVAFGDQFAVQVSASVGERVDETARFDEPEAVNFDDGLSVVAGSFAINDVSIAVDAADSIVSVLAKINASSANVTASFDEASERVVLEQQTPGSQATVEVGQDTSGFLAATKLVDAVAEPGTSGDLDSKLAAVASLSGITTGTFKINDHTITVDVDEDSLSDVLARINEALPEVSVEFVASRGTVSIEGGAGFILEDGSSGFLAALGLTDGTYTPQASGQGRLEFADGRLVRDRFRDFEDSVNRLFEHEGDPIVHDAIAAVRAAIGTAIGSALSGASSGDEHRRFGISISKTEDGGVRDFRIDFRRLRSLMEVRPQEIHDFLSVDKIGASRGFLDRLDHEFESIGKQLRSQLHGGVFVDRTA